MFVLKFHIQCIFLIWIFTLTQVRCYMRKELKNKEYINVEVKESGRVRRSTDYFYHSENYDLDLTLQRSNIHLHLERNDNFDASVPMFSVTGNSIRNIHVEDQTESIFYQDTRRGAVFVLQNKKSHQPHVFGSFHFNGEEYTIQTDLNGTKFSAGLNRFEIGKEAIPEVDYYDFVHRETMKLVAELPRNVSHHRHRRATGNHQLELLMFTDYAVYKHWYDKSTKPTATEREAEALTSIKQYYAFVLVGMDGMYKNIQTSAYTIDIVYAGIVIAQTPGDSPWTETIKVTAHTPNRVDSSNGLSNFNTWIQTASGLPGHDHAMLFTRYDLTSSGSTGNAGLAYLSRVCTSSSQSIVEDRFNFIIITVASHELGHCLSAQHDGEGNSCALADAYIMAASSSPQTDASTADHPWIFSTCSTAYFSSYIDTLDASNNNCMKTLSAGFDPTGQTPYEQNLPGQIYSADQQCQQIRGDNSYFCNDRYSNDFTTLCSVMWCADPSGNGYCNTNIAGDGTHCGVGKWCKTGVCVSDPNAPQGNSACLYGDRKGIVINSLTCAEAVAQNKAFFCQYVAQDCCYSCSDSTTTSTTTTPATTTTTTPFTGSTLSTTSAPTTTMTSTPSTTTTQGQTITPDQQCVNNNGGGWEFCRFPYNNDYSSICQTLWCSVSGSNSCSGSGSAADYTQCGNQKWCISGVCTSDSNAPAGDESCLYGDEPGVVFLNGWSCQDMVREAPNNCVVVPEKCCASCAPPTTTSTTTAATSTLSTTIETTTMPSTTTETTTTPPTTMAATTTMATTTPSTTTMTTTTISTTTETTTTPSTTTIATTSPSTTTMADTTTMATTTPSTTKMTTTIISTTSETTTTPSTTTESTTTPSTTTIATTTSSTTTMDTTTPPSTTMATTTPSTTIETTTTPSTTTETTTTPSTTTERTTTPSTTKKATTTPSTTTMATTTPSTTTEKTTTPFTTKKATTTPSTTTMATTTPSTTIETTTTPSTTSETTTTPPTTTMATTTPSTTTEKTTTPFTTKKATTTPSTTTMATTTPSTTIETTTTPSTTSETTTTPPTTTMAATTTMATTTPSTTMMTTTTISTTTETTKTPSTTTESTTTPSTTTIATTTPSTTTKATTTPSTTIETTTTPSTTIETTTPSTTTETTTTPSKTTRATTTPSTTIETTTPSTTTETTTTPSTTTMATTTPSTTIETTTTPSTTTETTKTPSTTTLATTTPSTTIETTTTPSSTSETTTTSSTTTMATTTPSTTIQTTTKPSTTTETITTPSTTTMATSTPSATTEATKMLSTTKFATTMPSSTTIASTTFSPATKTTTTPFKTTETTATPSSTTMATSTPSTATMATTTPSSTTETTKTPSTTIEGTTTPFKTTVVTTTPSTTAASTTPSTTIETTSTPSTTTSATSTPSTTIEMSTTPSTTTVATTTSSTTAATTTIETTTTPSATSSATSTPSTTTETTTRPSTSTVLTTTPSTSTVSTTTPSTTIEPTTTPSTTTMATTTLSTTTMATTTTAATTTLSTTPPTTYKPGPGEYRFRIIIRINIVIIGNLNDPTTQYYITLFQQTLIALTNYYQGHRSCGRRFRRCNLYGIRRGSLIADHDVILDDDSSGSVVSAVDDLITGVGNVTIGNETTGALSATVTDDKGSTATVTTNSDLCTTFNQITGCPDGYTCLVDSATNTPYCSLSVVDNTDKYGFILGLAIGIPLSFIIIAMAVVFCIVYNRSKDETKEKKVLDDNFQVETQPGRDIFAHSMPYRYHSSAKKDYFFNNMHNGFWDNEGLDISDEFDNKHKQWSHRSTSNKNIRSKSNHQLKKNRHSNGRWSDASRI